MHESLYARSLYARITLCTKIFMHDHFMHESLYARITLCTVKSMSDELMEYRVSQTKFRIYFGPIVDFLIASSE
jgi:hypothetical protein